MFKSYRVGSVFDIPIRLDVTFLIILPAFAWLIGVQIGELVPLLNDAFGTGIDETALTEGSTRWVLGAVAATALFTCVVLHELGHSVVALHYGYEIESITLWLLGGIARPAELPKNWRHEFFIAIAGPAVNIGIATGCLALLALLPSTDAIVFLLVYLGVLNVGLAVFNLLPAFPLDGGRVLRALLGRSRPYVRATRQAAAVGKGMAVLLALVGILSLNFILIAIALFVYIAATSETRQMMLDAAFEGLEVGDVMTPASELRTVEPDLALSELLDIMLELRHVGYPVVDDGALVGIVTLEDVQDSHADDGVVAAAMTPREEVQTVTRETPVMDAFETLNSSDGGRLPVVEDGQLVGIVTRTDLMRAFRIVTQQERFDRRDLPAPAKGEPGD
jgi:Zn-dependent protease/predicted transcriptional regulator